MRTDELRERHAPPNAMSNVSGMVTPDIAETLRQIILKTTHYTKAKLVAGSLPTHSYRKATMGFTLLADLAGSRAAISAIRISSNVTMTNVPGSFLMGRSCSGSIIALRSAVPPW